MESPLLLLYVALQLLHLTVPGGTQQRPDDLLLLSGGASKGVTFQRVFAPTKFSKPVIALFFFKVLRYQKLFEVG